MRDFCLELLEYCDKFRDSDDILLKKKISNIRGRLRWLLKKIGDGSTDAGVNYLSNLNLCEICYKVQQLTGGLPDSVSARLVLGEKNYWSCKCLGEE